MIVGVPSLLLLKRARRFEYSLFRRRRRVPRRVLHAMPPPAEPPFKCPLTFHEPHRMSRPHPDPLPQEREQHVTAATTLSTFGIQRPVHGHNALSKDWRLQILSPCGV